MNKVVIFDWVGVVESHENNCRDLKEAKIQLMKKYFFISYQNIRKVAR